MISLLTCCKTHQSMIEKSTTIATDTTTISRVAAKDSASAKAKIDSIIIEEYNQEERLTESVSQKEQKGYIGSWQKRNDTSQNEVKTPSKKIKIYGVSLSSTRLANKDSLNKQTTHKEKRISQVKQKTPIRNAAGGKIVYILIAIVVILFAGYLYWKNAVQ